MSGGAEVCDVVIKKFGRMKRLEHSRARRVGRMKHLEHSRARRVGRMKRLEHSRARRVGRMKRLEHSRARRVGRMKRLEHRPAFLRIAGNSSGQLQPTHTVWGVCVPPPPPTLMTNLKTLKL